MTPQKFIRPARQAFTLIEIMIVVVIVMLLTLMAWKAYGIYVQKAESVACALKMANFGKALQGHMNDHHSWPQEEAMFGGNKAPSQEALWDKWYEILAKQGLAPDDWYCPSDLARRKKEKKQDDEGGESHILNNPSYQPAQFGPGPYEPYETRQPWAIETFGHYDGFNMVMPDGSTQKEYNFKAVRGLPNSGGGGGKK